MDNLKNKTKLFVIATFNIYFIQLMAILIFIVTPGVQNIICNICIVFDK